VHGSSASPDLEMKSPSQLISNGDPELGIEVGKVLPVRWTIFVGAVRISVAFGIVHSYRFGASILSDFVFGWPLLQPHLVLSFFAAASSKRSSSLNGITINGERSVNRYVADWFTSIVWPRFAFMARQSCESMRWLSTGSSGLATEEPEFVPRFIGL
jgi:hypothetical protein